MFELVVFIISVAIIYASAANRFAEFPGDAERANFLSVTTQLQAAVNLELLLAMTSGQRGLLNSYENANPMDILLETPSNYLGAFDLVSTEALPRRSWYFDRQRGELVYLVNISEDVYLISGNNTIPTDEIRFTMTVVYRDEPFGFSMEESADESVASVSNINSSNQKVSGLVLKPVVPYLWSPSESDLALLAYPQN